jgi:hemoglobin
MEVAHDGLGISQADFDALIEDVVMGLTEAGVREEDIQAAAPALLGMQDAIVEDATDDLSQAMCLLPDAGAQPNPDSGAQVGQRLCEKYGGADAVKSVVENDVIGTIAADCRINTFFTSLTNDGFGRVNDCLAIQVQELFGCDGVSYEGSIASNGLPCRSMTVAHQGLGISAADFDALIEDVVAGMTQAGVEEADIAAAAPALLGMEPDIVEDDTASHSREACMLDAGVTQ